MLRDLRTIALGALAGFALAVIIGLAIRPYYTSTFSFLPQTTQDQSRSGIANLAGQFGIPVGMLGSTAQPPQLYAELLKTRGVLEPIAQDTVPALSEPSRRVPLSSFLGVQESDTAVRTEMTIRKLRERVIGAEVAARTTGAVTVRVRTRSAVASQRIAQRLLDGLNRFNSVTRMSQAAEERRFIEGRLADARAALRSAEDDLQSFLQANRQYANAPALKFQEDRLERAVSLQQSVVNGLAQQFEDARIREVRDTPVITVIERPTIPVLPDPRGRLRIAILCLLLGLVGGIAFVLGREGWRRQKAAEPDPSFAMLDTEWRRFRNRFRRA